MEVKRERGQARGQVHPVAVSILVLMEVKRERARRLIGFLNEPLFQSLF